MRILLRLVACLTALWTLPILLIRGHPYHDDNVRAFLTVPDNCAVPCFMGIRPGITTVDEAIAILDEHAWVANVTVDLYANARYLPPNLEGVVTWDWSGLQPPEIDTLHPVRLRIVGSKVAYVFVPSHLTFGQLLLTLGPPDAGGIFGIDDASSLHLAQMTYADRGFAFEVAWHCRTESAWQPATVKLAAKSTVVVTQGPYGPRENINLNQRRLAFC
ncbi:MAG: hypothetical protein CL610_22005 [Anaerolineaceae bacterium]|nr:hypothetical protein [Anaerolineaceae bacterium]